MWTWRGLVTYYTLFVIEWLHAACNPRQYAVPRRSIHDPGRPHGHSDRRRSAGPLPRPDLRPGSEVERSCTRLAGGIRRTRGADALPSAELQRIRGAVRAIYDGGVPESGEFRWENGIFGRRCTSSSSMTFRERNHQGLNNELIEGQPSAVDAGRIRRRQRLGGFLNYYYRAA